ncbi:putative membrane protein [Bartonella silvatica]|uniref:Membrane protein n=1 Tax=Bartonella silvatica TaxID=357760 RepID=A0ABV2HH49_9HYPH
MLGLWTMVIPFLILLFGMVCDVLLSIVIVALYYSFIKRLVVYYRVSKTLKRAMKNIYTV